MSQQIEDYEKDTFEWHEQRRKGVGASEVAAACGFSRWKSRYYLWQEKRGLVAPWSGNTATLWGQRNERFILDDWAELHQAQLTQSQSKYVDARFPHLWATLDAVATMPDGTEVVVEAKCTTSRNSELGEEGTDDAPAEWLAQVQVQMLLSRIHSAWIAVLVDGNKAREYRVEFDEQVATHLARKAEAWYVEAMACETPPATWASTDEKIRRLADFGSSAVVDMIDTPLASAWEEYEELGRKIKELEQERQQAKDHAVILMGDNSRCLIAPGRELAIQERKRAAYIVKAASYVTLSARKVK